MPNYYAHQKFGRQVLDMLPEEARALLKREQAAFLLGCLGPDPLFFYRPSLPNKVRREGMFMHAHAALPTFQRMREPVEEGQPMAAGYAAGFLCHLALDSGCHGWLIAKAARGLPTHLGMEAEFDRLLMLRDGQNPLGVSYLPSVPSPQVFSAAARAYQHTSPLQLEESYRSMRRSTLLLSRLSGKPFTPVINRVVGSLPGIRPIKDIFLPTQSPAQFGESNQYLDRKLNQCAAQAAEQIVRFLRACATGTSLDTWLDRDFKGTLPLGESDSIPRSALAY